jgi:hypothetical protein
MDDVQYYYASLLDNFAMPIVPIFEAAKELHLTDLIAPMSEGLRDSTLSAFGGIEDLTLSCCDFSSLLDLANLIKAFPLKRLTLCHNIYRHGELPSPSATSPTSQFMMPTFEQIGCLNGVWLLSLEHSEVPTLAKLLRDIGPSLSHIYFNRPSFLMQYSSESAFTLI